MLSIILDTQNKRKPCGKIMSLRIVELLSRPLIFANYLILSKFYVTNFRASRNFSYFRENQ